MSKSCQIFLTPPTRKNLSVNVHDVVCLCTGCLHGDSACKYSDYVDEWRGFDMLKFKDINVNMSLWNLVNIHKKMGSCEEFKWEDVRAILQSFSDYDEALAYVKKNPLPFLDCHIDIKLSEHDRENIDPVALHYVPADASCGLTPCKIAGDGNCFPRTLSYICFRSQENDAEFRVRLEYEALLNGKHYLSNRYLSRGCNIVYRKGGPCKQIAMYSETYNPNEELDVQIYKKEVLSLTQNGQYCGLWQIAQASNVLRRPIVSVYPTELHEGM